MNKVNIEIWGRNFELYISYHCFPEENVSDMQTRAAELLPTIDFNSSLEDVKKYILKNDKERVGDDSIENIFKYVKPKCVMITRNELKRELAVMCDYKFDMEHGIAVVYENEKFKQVGSQDIIL